MQNVPELVLLRLQIFFIGFVGRNFERDALDDLESVPFDASSLNRVVRNHSHPAHAEIHEDLGADSVITLIGRETQLVVGLNRVEPFIVLKRISSDLVLEPDAATFLTHVEQNPAALFVDHGEGLLQLLSAITSAGSECIPRQTFAMDAHEHRLVRIDIALHKRHVVDVVDVVFVDDATEGAAGHGGHICLGDTANQLFVGQAEFDEIFDRDDFEVMNLRVCREVVHPRHRSVVVHDLADHAGWFKARESAMAASMVRERSCAEIPVVTPSRASIDTVKAVP